MRHMRLLLLVLLLATARQASAQLGDMRHNWAVGANAALSMNRVSFVSEVAVKQQMQLTPACGLTARYISEKYFAMLCGIQLELNWAQRGWKEDPEEKPYAYERTMNYLEIPFMVHLAFGNERKALFFVNAGPQLALLLNEKESFGGDWQGLRYEQHGKSAERRFDYGIVGGAGVELCTRAGHFLLEGRYHFGLADFFHNTKRDYFGRSAHTNISVRLTYLFDLTR